MYQYKEIFIAEKMAKEQVQREIQQQRYREQQQRGSSLSL
jgi:hypothetical protein